MLRTILQFCSFVLMVSFAIFFQLKCGRPFVPFQRRRSIIRCGTKRGHSSSLPEYGGSFAAVLCRASPCCVLCCTFTSSYMPVTFEVSYHVPLLLILHQVCTCYVVVGSQTMRPQLRSARLVRCRALPFVLRCCVVRRCAF